MTGGYEIGAVYVWVCEDSGMEYLKGTECIVTGPSREYSAGYLGALGTHCGWPTDSPLPNGDKNGVTYAFAGDLRRKQPPSGELSIIRMFDLTAPAPREVEAA